jgi:hypothetical protein
MVILTGFGATYYSLAQSCVLQYGLIKDTLLAPYMLLHGAWMTKPTYIQKDGGLRVGTRKWQIIAMSIYTVQIIEFNINTRLEQ